MRDDMAKNFTHIVKTLGGGDLVVMKSDTIYGIFCAAREEKAVAKLHAVRERNAAQGFIVLADSVATIGKIVNLRPEISKRLSQIWNGRNAATSVILAAYDIREKWLPDMRPEFNDTICFRVPNDENLRKLLRETGPLCAPSANLAGEIPAQNIAEAKNYFGENVKLYVDGGEVRENSPSRIIKFRENGTVETVRGDNLPHPEDFIISRKRKLYKFAKFLDDERCFDLEKWVQHRAEILPKNREIVVEIGAGSAIFLTKLAAQNPNKIFVAMDRKSDRLWQGAKLANKLNLDNIFYVWAEAAKLNQVFAKNSLSEIWLTFPDPFAKNNYQDFRAEMAEFYHKNLRFSDDKNFAKNSEIYNKKLREFSETSRKKFGEFLLANGRSRLTAPKFLESYAKVLHENGILNFKTDNTPLFEWSLQNFAAENWQTEFISQDLHDEKSTKNFIREAQIMTTYEEKFASEGWPICFARFIAPSA